MSSPRGESSPEDFREFRRSGDDALRDQLLADHTWIARHCARRFADRGEPLDDLIQVGQIGLLKALQRFDPDFGSSFTTFAVPTVLGEIRRYFRDSTWAVRVPRRLKELHVQLGAAKEDLATSLGRAPRPQELADYLGIGIEDALEAIEASGGYRSTPLTMPTDNGGDATREHPCLKTVDRDLEGTDDRVLVARLLDSLPERERTILALRFFEDRSQAEIAEIVGVSQVHVSRLLRSSLASLQSAARDSS